MGKDNKSEDKTLSAYIGFSAPETPKYFLTNNFLSEFFHVEEKLSQVLDYSSFEKTGSLINEEDNKEIKEKMENSFNQFFQRFSGEDTIKSKYKTKEINNHFYFPLTPRMLRTSNMNLRHLLFNMLLYENKGKNRKEKFEKIQEKLNRFLFTNTIGVNHILYELCSSMLNNNCSIKKEFKEIENNKSFDILKEKAFFKELGKQLGEDLNILLTNSYFTELDFYKKYDYLSTLLGSYVVYFIVRMKDNKAFILCKGSSTDTRLNEGGFHKASVENYVKIRSVFKDKLVEFYLSKLNNTEKIRLEDKDNNVYVNGSTFKNYVKDKFTSNFRNEKELERLARKNFGLSLDIRIKELDCTDFVKSFVDISGSIGGASLTKISSTLPTIGKEIGIVFPANSIRFKFFAMSHALIEYFVRLYLAKNNVEYAYLDAFLSFLQTTYGIFISESDKIKKEIKTYRAKITRSEFRQNTTAFMNTLQEVNCLVKLSDSGYIITLPEKKGELKFL